MYEYSFKKNIDQLSIFPNSNYLTSKATATSTLVAVRIMICLLLYQLLSIT